MVTRRGFVKGGVVALTAPWFGGKRTPDGRTVCGLPLVGEDFQFRHYLDHQYPKMGEHARDPDPDAHHIRAGVAVAVTLAFAEAL